MGDSDPRAAAGYQSRVAIRLCCLVARTIRVSAAMPHTGGTGLTQAGMGRRECFRSRCDVGAARIVGEIHKLPAPTLPVVRGLWSQPRNFLSLRQYVAALPVSAAQAAAVRSL